MEDRKELEIGREAIAMVRRMQRGTATVEDILRCATSNGRNGVGTQWGLEDSEYGANWADNGAEDYAFVNDDTIVKAWIEETLDDGWDASDDEIWEEFGDNLGEIQVILVGDTDAPYVSPGWDASIGQGQKLRLTEVRYNAGWGWKRLPANGRVVTSAHVVLDRNDFLAQSATVNGITIEFSSYGDAVPGGYNGGWVAYVDGKRAGYLDYQTERGSDDVLIAMIEVDPQWRGKGISDALLARLKAEFPKGRIDPGVMTEDGARWWKKVTSAATPEVRVSTSAEDGFVLYTLVASIEGQTAGSLEVEVPDDVDVPATVNVIDTKPQYRRRGVASTLMQTMVEIRDEMWPGREIDMGTFTDDGRAWWSGFGGRGKTA